MEPYTGFEPEVGEIRAVRTFRIGPDGLLYPLFSDAAWSSATNTARCKLAGMQAFLPERNVHETPEPDCTCGYYAYSSESAAREYPNAQHVLAVVACWGRVIAGTRGVRTEHARVETLWMSAAVPEALAGTVAANYPNTAIYVDKHLMLTEHPLTELDCYEPEESTHLPRLAVRIAVGLAIGLGLLPYAWISANRDLQVTWLLEFIAFLVVAVHAYRGGPVAKRRAVQSFAVVLWLVAPFGGAAGTVLLRIPLIQLASLVFAQRRAMSRAANRFPARIASLGPQP